MLSGRFTVVFRFILLPFSPPTSPSRCLTSEITMEFVFAKPASLLQESNTTFGSWFLDAFDTAAESFWLMQELPWLWKIANYLPLSFVTIVKPEAASMFRLLQVSIVHCSNLKKTKSQLTALCFSMPRPVSCTTRKTATPPRTQCYSTACLHYPIKPKSARHWSF